MIHGLGLRLSDLERLSSQLRGKYEHERAETPDELLAESEAFRWTGFSYFSGGDYNYERAYEMAAFCFRVAMELDPTDARPALLLGHIRSRQGDEEAALEQYLETFRRGLKNLDLVYHTENVYLHIAVCYHTLGRLDEAEAYLLAGIAKDEGCREHMLGMLALMWHQAERYDLAEEYYRQWLAYLETQSEDRKSDMTPAKEVERGLRLAQARTRLPDSDSLVSGGFRGALEVGLHGVQF